MSVRSPVFKYIARPKSALLHAVVKGKGEGDSQWKEVADLLSYSSTGSSFDLPRECEVGTLISMVVPLPPHIRCYDHDKEFYCVWGLVQHCEPMTVAGSPRFHIGVAFIGKCSPKSYRDNPFQHYRISGVKNDGMWNVGESKRPFRKRTGVRFWQSVDLYLALIDTRAGALGGERTSTENLSRSGAAVFTTMNVGIGDRVKFISEEYDFSGLAVVCNTQVCDDNRTRLHLHFVETTFPVTKLMKSTAESNRS